jgi:hypothetical protein
MVHVGLAKLSRLSDAIVENTLKKRRAGGTRIRNCIRQKLSMGSRSTGKEGTTVEKLVISSLIVGFILAKR